MPINNKQIGKKFIKKLKSFKYFLHHNLQVSLFIDDTFKIKNVTGAMTQDVSMWKFIPYSDRGKLFD